MLNVTKCYHQFPPVPSSSQQFPAVPWHILLPNLPTGEVFFVLALVYLSEFLSSDTSEDVIAERSSEAKESLGGDDAKGKDGEAKSNKGWKDARSSHSFQQFPAVSEIFWSYLGLDGLHMAIHPPEIIKF